MANYRKLYSKHFGITWDSKDFDVHHINGNREDNEIQNLILLPKKLHQRLHTALREIQMSEIVLKERGIDLSLAAAYESMNFYGFTQHLSCTQDYLSILEECFRWGFLKVMYYTRPMGEHIPVITLETKI